MESGATFKAFLRLFGLVESGAVELGLSESGGGLFFGRFFAPRKVVGCGALRMGIVDASGAFLVSRLLKKIH